MALGRRRLNCVRASFRCAYCTEGFNKATPDTNKVERTWQNTHVEYEGVLPLLNSVNSPVST